MNPFSTALDRFKGLVEHSETTIDAEEEDVDMATIFGGVGQHTTRNYAKDRRLHGKARVKARKAEQRAARVS